jgi:acetylornithine deacetylase/succinyl-diaminopimelate desuccinylase-like protein
MRARSEESVVEAAQTGTFVEQAWESSVLPALTRYIEIPNKSPHFDAEWESHGHMDRALDLIAAWCRANAPRDATVAVHRLPGRTPLILIDVPGDATGESVLLYGHYDKQPEMTGWRSDLGPWTPVIEGDRLYGRGGADDGYSTFAALTALRALEDQGVPHGRCVILIEGCEESGSFDLPFYLDSLGDALAAPGLIVCLDSGCGNYEQLWGTTSLRGLVAGTLSVELLSEGVHSGSWSGIVASSFRVCRMLLSRIEDEATGEVLLPEFHVVLPPGRAEEVEALAAILDGDAFAELPLVPGARPAGADVRELILNATWRPALSVTGAGGLPAIENAGNVLRPVTKLKLSLRIPPTCDADAATRRLKQTLEADPPYGARVSFEADQGANGWNAPATAPWLRQSLDNASSLFFGRAAAFKGEGGSIPFMAMLGQRFPASQFLITGVLGPGANAHGPNEFLHIPTAKRLTSAVAHVVADHHRHATASA